MRRKRFRRDFIPIFMFFILRCFLLIFVTTTAQVCMSQNGSIQNERISIDTQERNPSGLIQAKSHAHIAALCPIYKRFRCPAVVFLCYNKRSTWWRPDVCFGILYRYVSWQAAILRPNNKVSQYDAVPFSSPHYSNYYVQEEADDGVVMESSVPFKDVRIQYI